MYPKKPFDLSDPSVLLGIVIRRARTAKGLTQVELARAIGRSMSYLSYIENGKASPGSKRYSPPKPKYDDLDAIAHVLGLDADQDLIPLWRAIDS